MGAKVGYYDPFGVWPEVQQHIHHQLPFKNTHVQLDVTQTYKTISQLPVHFVEEVPKTSDYHSTEEDESINNSIYTRLMFVKFNDIDTYRGQVRPLIREWLKHLVFRNRNCTWMIIFYIPPEGKDRHSNLIKTSHFDKLKLDFGALGKQLGTILPSAEEFLKLPGERCFKLKVGHDADIWNEFAVQLKSQLVSAFCERYSKYKTAVHEGKFSSQILAKLKMYYLFCDMCLLQEARSWNTKLIDDLRRVAPQDDYVFQHKVKNIPQSLDDFKLQTMSNEHSLKEQLLQGENIDLFGLRCLLFTNEGSISEKLAVSAFEQSLLPTASKEIAHLFQILIVFLRDLEVDFSRHYELEYMIIQQYLALPIVRELFAYEPLDPNDDSLGPAFLELVEVIAEIKMAKRFIITKLAERKGFHIEALESIILDEVDINELQLFTNLTNFIASSQELLQILKDKDSFVQYFESMTEEIIEDFDKCGRGRTVDILSLDLAAVSYERGDYESCLASLTHEYYNRNGWDLIGGALLDIYLKCMEKLGLGKKRETLIASAELFSRLNSLEVFGFNKKAKKLYQSILEFEFDDGLEGNEKEGEEEEEEEEAGEVKIKGPVKFAIRKFFPVIKVKPFVYADETTDKNIYKISIEVVNPFHIEISLSKIKLTLRNAFGEKVYFTCFNKILSATAESQIIDLTTRNIVFGEFAVEDLTLHMGKNLVLSTVFDAPILDTSSQVPQTSMQDQLRILIYQDCRKLYGRFRCATQRSLLEKSVLLSLTNGKCEIDALKVVITSPDANVEFPTSTFHTDALSPQETKTISVQFRAPENHKRIHFQAQCSYQIEQETFSFQISETIDISLCISISVQDVFKSDLLFSKFQVGTVDGNVPIRILSHSLENDNYEIRGGLQESSVVVYDEKPASLIYRIRQATDEPKKLAKEDLGSLKLSVKYKSIKEEAGEALAGLVRQHLVELDMLKYWLLLQDTILHQAQLNLIRFSTSNVVEITNKHSLILLAERVIVLHVDSEATQKTLIELLETITAKSEKIESKGSDGSFEVLTIDVSVPSLQYLHTIEFQTPEKVVMVGDPFLVKLSIDCTTRWKNTQGANSFTNGSTNINNGSDFSIKDEKHADLANLDSFVLEIVQTNDFLLDGMSSCVFSVSNSGFTHFEYELTLIPLTVGKVKFPRVNVIPFGKTADIAYSDTHLINAQEVLTVVPFTEEIALTF